MEPVVTKTPATSVVQTRVLHFRCRQGRRSTEKDSHGRKECLVWLLNDSVMFPMISGSCVVCSDIAGGQGVAGIRRFAPSPFGHESSRPSELHGPNPNCRPAEEAHDEFPGNEILAELYFIRALNAAARGSAPCARLEARVRSK
jgi:hypothetical protein